MLLSNRGSVLEIDLGALPSQPFGPALVQPSGVGLRLDRFRGVSAATSARASTRPGSGTR